VSPELPPFEAQFDEHSFLELGLNELHSIVMPLFVIGPERWTGLGTAFTIANEGLMLTARHVIEEALQLCDETPGAYVAVVYVASGEGRDVPGLFGGPIPVRRVAISSGTDIAGLELAVPIIAGDRLVLPALRLSPGYPSVGETTMALGYNLLNATIATVETSNIAVDLEHRFVASQGTITQVHGEKRDIAMLSWPCFETTGRTDLGMSGGPVVGGSHGRVCGVVCSGLHAHEDVFTSWASVLAPALGLSFSEEVDTDSESLLELARRGLINVDASIDLISLSHNVDGTHTIRVLRPRATESE
jgi:S1-C subfamily serine protease